MLTSEEEPNLEKINKFCQGKIQTSIWFLSGPDNFQIFSGPEKLNGFIQITFIQITLVDECLVIKFNLIFSPILSFLEIVQINRIMSFEGVVLWFKYMYVSRIYNLFYRDRMYCTEMTFIWRYQKLFSLDNRVELNAWFWKLPRNTNLYVTHLKNHRQSTKRPTLSSPTISDLESWVGPECFENSFRNARLFGHEQQISWEFGWNRFHPRM